jgi:peptidoglycan/LPS O-acetylase OafA/YrhL
LLDPFLGPVSPVAAIACLLAALATSFLLVKRFGAPPAQGRHAAIDGLRGYLALFVFLHHGGVWYFYLRTGRWEVPPSHLYTHLGQGSVEVFFMITGFLFFSKLIEAGPRGIDWGRFFVARFLRLVPLYLLAMLLLFVLVACLSGGALNEPLPKLLGGMARWLGFTVGGAPDLNRIAQTYTLVAGVMWSLPYEWFFYFSLPLLALAARVIPPARYIALGIAAAAGWILWRPAMVPLLAFLGGIAAAVLYQWEAFRRFSAGRVASLAALGCIAMAVGLYASAFGAGPVLLLSAAFALIACGNTLFGALVSPMSRRLGEMAYGIYLLHGMLLFVTFYFIFGVAEAQAFSPALHWLVVLAVTPVLVVACFAAFRLIESPAMRSAAAVTARLRARLTTPSTS